MMSTVLSLDVGGANIKVAVGRNYNKKIDLEYSETIPFVDIKAASQDIMSELSYGWRPMGRDFRFDIVLLTGTLPVAETTYIKGIMNMVEFAKQFAHENSQLYIIGRDGRFHEISQVFF